MKNVRLLMSIIFVEEKTVDDGQSLHLVRACGAHPLSQDHQLKVMASLKYGKSYLNCVNKGKHSFS